jgi:hypothetical protein
MAEDPNHPKPFAVEMDDFPEQELRALFGPGNCFAEGNFTKMARRIVLGGHSRIIKFGKNQQGRNCMFVLDGDVSNLSALDVGLLFEFDHLGRVVDFRFGNGVPRWRMNIPNGTHASFGLIEGKSIPYSALSEEDRAKVDAIDERLRTQSATLKPSERDMLLLEKKNTMQNMRWGVRRVLKGSMQFMGCVRHDIVRGNPYIQLVDGIPCVSCVHATRELDETFEAEAKNFDRMQTYFEYDPITKESKFGSKSSEYYDGEGFGNQFGNPGHTSFLVRASNGSVNVDERRKGHSPYPRPIPARLSANGTDFSVKLNEGFASVQLDMKALRWLETHPLVFPVSDSFDQTFVDSAFEWVQTLSTQFKQVTLSRPALLAAVSSGMSPAARLMPGMRKSLFETLTAQPATAFRQAVNHCTCSPTNHVLPMCPNRFCPYRHARLESFEFTWPPFEFEPNPEQPALKAEKMQMKEQTEREQEEAAKRKQAALLVQEEANRKRALEHKKHMAEINAQNKAMRAQSAEKKAQELAALGASAEASAAPARTLRGRRSAATPVASVASAAPVTPVASAAVASAGPASTRRPRSATPSAASSASSSTKRKARGGAKSKSKSKRRLRK